MDCKIVNCKCGEKIGVITEDGFMIGNFIFESFNAYCPTCERYLVYEDFELEIFETQNELGTKIIFEF
jgi:hypothetical protein